MKVLRVILSFVLFLSACLGTVHAQGATGEIDQRIAELEAKVKDLQNQENSLKQKINLLDSEIALTTLRIDSIKKAIVKLETEIEEITHEIERLELIKTKRLELVLHRIPITYKRAQIPQLDIILFSQNFSDFLTRIKYLNRVQQEEALLYKQLQNTQDTYSQRKDLRETKKAQQESLKAQLEKQSWELSQQKREKQVLLAETKNSEAVYQQLLAQALAEKQALERALVDAVKVGPVKKGEAIALVGNTGYPGCSTGPHLHFEVRKNNAWGDPGGYLSGKTVYDDESGSSMAFGSGSWDWPLADPIRLTQRYGHTPWSYRYTYSGGIHTGYDMTSSGSTVIKAPADGDLYSSSQACGGSSIIKIKYIDHGDNVVSFYLHVQ